jgi:hypothetical protein
MDFIPPNDFTAHEERLINIAVERALLLMPEAVENMIRQKTMTREMAKKFFEDNKEMSAHIDLVQKTIEQVEMDNPGIPYSRILEKATPLVKERLLTLSQVDFNPVSERPDPVLNDTQPDFGTL